MQVIAYDPFVAECRYRELGVEMADDAPRTSTAPATSSPSTWPRRPRRAGLRRPRGLRGDEARRPPDQRRPRRRGRTRRRWSRRWQSGHLGGAGIDVFPAGAGHREPPLRHAGRGRDAPPGRVDRGGPGPRRRGGGRAGRGRPHRRRGHLGGEHARPRARGARGARPLPAARAPARPAGRRARPAAASSPLEISYEGQLGDLDTRMLTSAVLAGVLQGHVEEYVNVVNAGSLAAERGIEWTRDHHAAGARLHQPPVGARGRREPERHDRRHHLAPAAGGGLRPAHRDRAGARTSGCSATSTSPARSAASGRSSAWRTSTSPRWRCRARAPRAAP